MNKKTEVAVITILIALALLAFLTFMIRKNSPQEVLVSTPVESDSDVAMPTPTQVLVSGNRVTIQWDRGSEELTFLNYAGYSFKSYMVNGVTDKIAVIYNNAEILQLWVNWVGYTQGSIPLSKPVKVTTSYLGDLYRSSTQGSTALGYYDKNAIALTGVCSGNGDDVSAPCALTDQLYGPNEVFSYLVVCNDAKYVAKCDDVMKGLKIF